MSLYPKDKYNLFPIKGDKRPMPSEWNASGRTFTASANSGFAVPRQVCILDMDVKNPKKDGAGSWGRLQQTLGFSLDAYITVRTPSGGHHAYFSVPGDRQAITKESHDYRGIDVLAGYSDAEAAKEPGKVGKYYCVAAGSVVDGGEYKLIGVPESIANPPPMPSALMDIFYHPSGWVPGQPKAQPALAPASAPAPVSASPFPSAPVAQLVASPPAIEVYTSPAEAKEQLKARLKDAQTLLATMPASEYEDWFRAALAIARKLGEDGRQVFHAWSSRAPSKYDATLCDEKYSKAMADRDSRPGEGVTMATLAFKHQEAKEALAVSAGATPKQDVLANALDAIIPGRDYTLRQLMSVVWYRMKGSKTDNDCVYHSTLIPLGITGNDLTTEATRGGYKKLQRAKVLDAVPFLQRLVEMGLIESKCDRQVTRAWDNRLFINDDPRLSDMSLINVFDNQWYNKGKARVVTEAEATRCQEWLGFLRNHFKGLASGNQEDGDAAFYWFIQALQFKKKPPYSLVITAKKGVGKSTLGDIASAILGATYFAMIDSDYTTGRFNDKIVGKTMVIGSEMHEVGTSVKAGDGRLKTLITDSTYNVEPKYRPSYDYEPNAWILLISNDIRFINFSEDERRYLGIICDAETAADFVHKYGLEPTERGDNDAVSAYYSLMRQPYEDAEFGRALRAYLWQDSVAIPAQYSGKFPYRTSYFKSFVEKSASEQGDLHNQIKALLDNPDEHSEAVGALCNRLFVDQRTLARVFQRDNGTIGDYRPEPSPAKISRVLSAMHKPHFLRCKVRPGADCSPLTYYRSNEFDEENPVHVQMWETFKEHFQLSIANGRNANRDA